MKIMSHQIKNTNEKKLLKKQTNKKNHSKKRNLWVGKQNNACALYFRPKKDF